MFSTGRGVQQSDEQAVVWYTRAGHAGDADAQYELGRARADGVGVERDAIEAARWYALAGEQGHAEAQSELGFMYEMGFSDVTQNYASESE